jgi:hypothetical protein
MSKKFVFEDKCDFIREDSGAALISYVGQVGKEAGDDEGLFIKIQSWDESLKHTDASTLAGKQVRVTVEVLDEVMADRYPNVPAECHSDDHGVEVNFDAGSWLMQASDEEILDLLKIGGGYDYASDVVAEYMANSNDEVATMFSYIEIMNKKPGARETIGFECFVAVDPLMAWVKENKPEIYAKVMKDEDILCALKTGYHPEGEG